MTLSPENNKVCIDFPEEIKKPGQQKRQASIHIGEYHASRLPTIIYTLLGSCVAVCIYDRKKSIGGMNHILLPGTASIKNFEDCARYGVNAMTLLINRVISLGGDKNRLAAKVFGGANLLPSIPYEKCVGKKNILFVLNFLSHESIPVISQDVGGNDSRKVYFHTDTGDVFLKRTLSIHYQQIVEQENKALKKFQKSVDSSNAIFYY
ncbi:chemotaxis protein CheD [Candidatus Magnetomorum sp. HK-1]|nr:chemotaxis protein CheD [Candidatus Magnetomorum sp. HK-1]